MLANLKMYIFAGLATALRGSYKGRQFNIPVLGVYERTGSEWSFPRLVPPRLRHLRDEEGSPGEKLKLGPAETEELSLRYTPSICNHELPPYPVPE